MAKHRTRRWERAHFVEPFERRRLLSLVVPAYSSLPGAPVNLYIDFDGSGAFDWHNNSDGSSSYHAQGPGADTTPIPAFDTDGNINDFSAGELTLINQIWQEVAEKYSPFTVNVTTVPPTSAQLGMTAIIIVGGSKNDWLNQAASGIAARDGFTSGADAIGFMFSGDYMSLDASSMTHFDGETIAHEAGHIFGLYHQSNIDGSFNVTQEYYQGTANDAPIMGASNNQYAKRGRWWNGSASEKLSDNSVHYVGIQDDISIITKLVNSIQVRNDTQTSPQTLNVDNSGKLQTGSGIIENPSDSDAFIFFPTSAHATFQIDNAPFGGMLAPTATIYQVSTGAAIPQTLTETTNRAVIETNSLSPGVQYRIVVSGHGAYGDIGQYTVNGQMQTFATLSPAGTLSVGGLPGGTNHITLDVTYGTGLGTLNVRDQFNGGGTSTQSFDISQVNGVNIFLGDFDDAIDLFDLLPLGSHSGIGVFADGGGGSNTLSLHGTNAFNTFNFKASGAVQAASAVSTSADQQVVNYIGIQKLQAVLTSSGGTVNITDIDMFTQVWVFGGTANDTLTIPVDVAHSPGAQIHFSGGGGSDTLVIPTLASVPDSGYAIFGDYVDVNTYDPNASERDVYFDSTVDNVSIVGGNGADGVTVYELNAGTTLTLDGGAGDDLLEVGYTPPDPRDASVPFSENMLGNALLKGGPGIDELLAFDNSSSPRTYTINDTNFHADAGGAVSYGRNDTEIVQINGPANHQGVFNVGPVGTLGAPPLALIGGDQPDIFTFTNALIASTSITGGLGNDTLTVDDRSNITGDSAVTLSSTALSRTFGGFGAASVNCAQVESSTYYSNTGPNVANVAATISGVPAGTWTLHFGSGNDTVTITDGPDSVANLSIDGAGGADRFVVDNSASTANGVNFTITPTDIQHLYGGHTADYFFSAIEQIVLNATNGNDLVAFTGAFAIPLSVNLLGGDDAVTFIGDNAPALQPFAAFDGGSGNDSFTMNDQTTAGNITYTASGSGSTMTLLRTNNSNGISYSVTSTAVETLAINAGNHTNSLIPASLLSGVALNYVGGSLGDTLTQGLSGVPVLIQGPINFNGGGAANVLQIQVNPSSVGATVHMTQSDIGAAAGDNYFGVGGSIHFTNVAAVTLAGGSGADTFDVQPSSTATISIVANSPTTVPGDVLNLATAGVTGVSVNPSGSNGNVTSANRNTIFYNSIESITQDAVAPAVTSAQLVSGQTISVQFSENVVMSAASITLLNQTTGQPFPTNLLATSYNSTTHVGTFTYPGGQFPAGQYAVSFATGSYLDTAGNDGAAANNVLRFITVPAGQTLNLGAGASAVLLDALNLGVGAKLDVGARALAIRNGNVGSWNGSAYSGVTGMVASGYDGGAWDGAGIITSQSNATGGNTLTTLAVAKAADVLGLTASQTTLWNGQSVDANTVLVKYTYSGDANLDGVVNGDDYFQTDSAFPQNLHGWLNGDFNFDGVINGDDYFLIDSTFPQQGPPL